MDFFCLVLSANKEFDDWFLLLCSELSSFDLLYVEGEMSDFWKPQLSDIYCFGSGIFISKLQFTVRSEILFDIGLWVYCIGVVRWEEILPILYVMFVIRLGDRIRRDSGMKLDFVCEFVRKFVCIDLWSFYFDSCIFVSKVIARIRRLGLIRCRYSGQVIFSMVIRTRI